MVTCDPGHVARTCSDFQSCLNEQPIWIIMHRNLFFGIALVLLSGSASSTTAADQPVNFVILLADDLGYNGVGCYGSDLRETPHIDALAQQGMRFTDAYAACTVCSPTRASIMTGKYPARLHLTDFIAGQHRPHESVLPPDWTKYLPHEEVTLAEALKQAGYATAHVGKWHLDPRKGELDPADFEPVDQGFDEQVLKPAARGYFLRQNQRLGIEEDKYLTDYLTDRTIDFLDRTADQPFLLYLAYHNPHTPIQAPQELVSYYQAKLKQSGGKAMHDNPVYAAMVHKLDENIGRVLTKLDELGIAQNTVVWFTSDNGGLTDRYGPPTGFTDNAPLRRGKGSAYEGGTRVPLIVRWPGIIKPAIVCNTPVSTIDIYPTFLEIAKAAGDPVHNKKVDGVSLPPLLRDPAADLQREALYWHYPHYHAGGDGPHGAIRAGDWKLIERYDRDQVELYNLATDIGEKLDLAKVEPGRAKKLQQMLADWRQSVGAQMPRTNPQADEVKARQHAEEQARHLQENP